MQLQFQGNICEGYADDKVFLVKSHFPSRPDPLNVFTAAKTICLIRSPRPVYVSGFHFTGSLSQNLSIDSVDFNQDFPDEWEEYLTYMTPQYKRFIESWILKRKEGYPVYFLRYEDLVENMSQSLTEVFQFVTGQKDLAGTLLSSRIASCSQEGGPGVYKRRAKKVKEATHFSKEQDSFIDSNLSSVLQFLGYTE